MKVVICVSNVRSRKQASSILKKVAKEIGTGHDKCIMGHLGNQGDYTYDILRGNPDLYVSSHGFTI